MVEKKHGEPNNLNDSFSRYR